VRAAELVQGLGEHVEDVVLVREVAVVVVVVVILRSIDQRVLQVSLGPQTA
jgi:hypothetical protein